MIHLSVWNLIISHQCWEKPHIRVFEIIHSFSIKVNNFCYILHSASVIHLISVVFISAIVWHPVNWDTRLIGWSLMRIFAIHLYPCILVQPTWRGYQNTRGGEPLGKQNDCYSSCISSVLIVLIMTDLCLPYWFVSITKQGTDTAVCCSGIFCWATERECPGDSYALGQISGGFEQVWRHEEVRHFIFPSLETLVITSGIICCLARQILMVDHSEANCRWSHTD